MWRKQKSFGDEKMCPSKDNDQNQNSALRDWFKTVCTKCQISKCFEGFRSCELNHVLSFEKLTSFLYQPTDPASLGVVRALFGLCMVLDVVEERGLSDIDIKWGDPMECHFPLIHGMRPPSLPWIIVIYCVMLIGAFGVMLGLCFKIACGLFVVSYWYIFLLDKSYWNNHTYLYGIVATLFWGTEANKYFALDAKKVEDAGSTVPSWNYFILKFQFFALYFLAGLKKSGKEWLDGYAMTNLSEHWVFSPFRLVLTTEQTDFLIVHWFAFVFDLTVGFWMLYGKTRIPAMIFCTAFHLMNSRLFSIGMFPYVCLATMPLFCDVNWPRKIYSRFNYDKLASIFAKTQNNNDYDHPVILHTNDQNEAQSDSIVKYKKSFEFFGHPGNEVNIGVHGESKVKTMTGNDQSTDQGSDKSRGMQSSDKNRNFATSNGDRKINRTSSKVTRRQKCVVSLLLFHVVLQFFLPYSHFITKGYNNWVPGLYGYSWDMMVYTWDTILVVIKVHDNLNNETRYLDPKAWVQTDRWERHADMARQYAHCLKDNLLKRRDESKGMKLRREGGKKWSHLSSNLSIYIDVWCSLNGRFQQRMFNPNVDLLTVDWNPFKPVSYIMPLLTQYNSYRDKLEDIQREVYHWSNYTDVLFVADFPGMHLDNYISTNFTNVSLTVLEGEVKYTDKIEIWGVQLQKGSSIPIKTGEFHKVKTTSKHPACYMYTYTVPTKDPFHKNGMIEPLNTKEMLPIMKEIKYKVNAWLRALSHITNAFLYLVYDVPMVRRVPIKK